MRQTALMRPISDTGKSVRVWRNTPSGSQAGFVGVNAIFPPLRRDPRFKSFCQTHGLTVRPLPPSALDHLATPEALEAHVLLYTRSGSIGTRRRDRQPAVACAAHGRGGHARQPRHLFRARTPGRRARSSLDSRPRPRHGAEHRVVVSAAASRRQDRRVDSRSRRGRWPTRRPATRRVGRTST